MKGVGEMVTACSQWGTRAEKRMQRRKARLPEASERRGTQQTRSETVTVETTYLIAAGATSASAAVDEPTRTAVEVRQTGTARRRSRQTTGLSEGNPIKAAMVYQYW